MRAEVTDMDLLAGVRVEKKQAKVGQGQRRKHLTYSIFDLLWLPG